MTTIATCRGWIAADRQVTSDRKQATYKLRTFTHPELGRCIGGGAGTWADIQKMWRWIDNEMQGPPPNGDFTFLIVSRESGRIEEWDVMQHKLVRTQIATPYAAIGTGERYAEAAMWCGKSARVAIRCAAEHDPHTGKGVDAIRLNRDNE